VFPAGQSSTSDAFVPTGSTGGAVVVVDVVPVDVVVVDEVVDDVVDVDVVDDVVDDVSS
jgi:hypothetical protein